MANSIGSLVALLGLDAGEYFAGLNKADQETKKAVSGMEKSFGGLGKSVEGFGKSFGGLKSAIGALGIGLSAAGITSFAKNVVDAADKMDELRNRTGLSGQELTVLQGAAVRGGLAMDDVSTIITKFTKNLGTVGEEGSKTEAAFKAMGISMTDANGKMKTVGQLLEEAGTKMRGYEDGLNKALLAQAAFGKGGDKLIPVVENIDKMKQRFKDLGIVIDEEFLTKAGELNDKTEDVISVMKHLMTEALIPLIPELIKFTETLASINRNGEVSDAINKIGEAMGTLGSSTVKAKADLDALAYTIHIVSKRLLNPPTSIRELKEFKAELENVARLYKDSREEAEKLALAIPFRDVKAGFSSTANKKEEAPELVDPKKIKAAEDALQKQREALAKINLDIVKDYAKRETDLLDDKYKHNEISAADYYSGLLKIQEDALKQSLVVLDSEIKQQQEVLKEAQAQAKGKPSAEVHQAETELVKLLAQRNKLQLDGAAAATALGRTSTDATKAYADEVERANIALLELQGNTSEAARRRAELEFRDPIAKARVERRPELVEVLQSTKQATVAQAQFNKAREEGEAISARLAIEEERVQNSLRVGAISEMDALIKTSKARRDAANEMEKFVEERERLARENPGLRNLQIEADQARVALEKLRAESNLLEDKFDQVFNESLATFLEDVTSGTKKLSDAFKDLGNNLFREINSIVMKSLAKDIMNAVGLGGEGGGTSPGKILGDIFSGGSLFGKKTGTQPSGPVNVAGTDKVLPTKEETEAFFGTGIESSEQAATAVDGLTDAAAKSAGDIGKMAATSLTSDLALNTLATSAMEASIALQAMSASASAASAGGGGGGGNLIGSMFGGGGGPVNATGIGGGGQGVATVAETEAFWGSFASGSRFIPHDMVAKLHRGERVITASENKQMGLSPEVNNVFYINGNVDRRSQSQIASATYRGMRRVANRTT